MKTCTRLLLLRFIVLLLTPTIGHAERLYFVHVSDTHIGSRGQDENTRKIVASINALPMPIACVIHTGDVTADALDRPDVVAATTNILGALKVPLHVVPGNHDIERTAIEKTASVYTNTFGKLAQAVEYGGVRFILVYTEPLARDVVVKGYDPLAEVGRLLAEDPDKPTIVCHHTPSVPDFYRNEMHPGWKPENANAWRELLEQYHVKAILAGHFHRPEQHWVGTIPLIVAPAVADYWDRAPCYRLCYYENGKLGYYTVYLQ